MEWSQILGFSVVGALVTTTGTILGLFLKDVLLARSFERWKAGHAIEQVARKYREPIALAGLELCNRLVQICRDYPTNFLDSELLVQAVAGPPLNTAQDTYFRRYRLLSTVYRLCSFLGWIELYRQDLTFLDPSDASSKRPTDRAVYPVRSDLADGQLNAATDWKEWRDGLLFREEQRAIGESMIVAVGSTRTVMGYAEFCDLYPANVTTGRGRWIGAAATFFLDPSPTKDFREVRMQRLIVHLVELVERLAPSRVRDEHRVAHSRYREVTQTVI